MFAILPLLGPKLIHQARARFTEQEEMRRQFRKIAKAVIADSEDRERSISLVLESVVVFVVRRKTVLRFIKKHELNRMVDYGLVKTGFNKSNEDIIVSRLPELLASEIALNLAQRLVREQWIGWDAPTRQQQLHRVINLSRFLIRPCVRCHNLASRVLGMSLRRVADDFELRYGYRPWLVESFVADVPYSNSDNFHKYQ